VRALLVAALIFGSLLGAPTPARAPEIPAPLLMIDQPEVPPALPAPSIEGIATWYDATKNHAWYTRKTKLGDPIVFYAAAGSKLRDLLGDPNPYHESYAIRITSLKTGISVDAWVVDWCSCSKGKPNEKLIDLSPELFQALGFSLSRGIQPVRVEIIEGRN
jgi:hypothetical protein